MVVYILERPNSQIYNIYINTDNILASVIIELGEFEEAYLNLLDKSKGIIIDSKDEFEFDVIKWTPLQLFIMVIEIMLFRSMVKWPKTVNDTGVLMQLYSSVYRKITEIQSVLSLFLNSVTTEHDTQVITKVLRGSMSSMGSGGKLSDAYLKGVLDAYHKVNMDSELRRVFASISKLSKEIEDIQSS